MRLGLSSMRTWTQIEDCAVKTTKIALKDLMSHVSWTFSNVIGNVPARVGSVFVVYSELSAT